MREMKRNVSAVRLIIATRSSGPPASQLGSEWGILYIYIYIYCKGKVIPITGHEGPEGE